MVVIVAVYKNGKPIKERVNTKTEYLSFIKWICESGEIGWNAWHLKCHTD